MTPAPWRLAERLTTSDRKHQHVVKCCISLGPDKFLGTTYTSVSQHFFHGPTFTLIFNIPRNPAYENVHRPGDKQRVGGAAL
jgi:hypothetical protein